MSRIIDPLEPERPAPAANGEPAQANPDGAIFIPKSPSPQDPALGLQPSGPCHSASPPAGSWPAPLDAAALHGLAGDIVRTLEPHTESDPAAILVQFLAAFGNCVGLVPHYLVEQNRHMPRLFVAVVGESSKARKGTAWGNVRALVSGADPAWAARMGSGLSSGEGLIWSVRDPSVKADREGKETLLDGGVTDKRLLVVESELASVLKAGKRESNTLSPIIRDAWDSSDLRTMTKNSPAKATGAHISIIGHITLAELRKTLGETDCLNGFGNRFLWVCAKRSKLLPDGGDLAPSDFKRLVAQLTFRLNECGPVREMRRTPAAKELWHAVYPRLTADRPGLFGSLTSRAEAQVLRLSIIFALLDGRATIEETHLRAALAVWRYCEDSARFIFGDRLDDPTAEKLRGVLHEAGELGMTRKEIGEYLHGHTTKPQLDAAFASLAKLGLAHCVTEPTNGRPAERWFIGASKAS